MRKYVVTLAVAALVLLTGSQLTAVAATTQHCVLHLSQGKTFDCYTTFTEAIADGTNGRVTDAPKAVNMTTGVDSTLRAKLDAAAVPSGSRQTRAAGGTVIGVEYVHSDFRPSSWTVEVDWGCDTNTDTDDWLLDSLGGTWLNDEISSYQTFANCWAAPHYEHAGWSGVRGGIYFPHTQEVRNMAEVIGVRADESFACYCMNDATSSIKWGTYRH